MSASPKSTTLWPHTFMSYWLVTSLPSVLQLIWSSDANPVSMLSLMAQWTDKDFNLIKAVLHSQEFTGSHSASAIPEAFEKMIETWKKCMLLWEITPEIWQKLWQIWQVWLCGGNRPKNTFKTLTPCFLAPALATYAKRSQLIRGIGYWRDPLGESPETSFKQGGWHKPWY